MNQLLNTPLIPTKYYSLSTLIEYHHLLLIPPPKTFSPKLKPNHGITQYTDLQQLQNVQTAKFRYETSNLKHKSEDRGDSTTLEQHQSKTNTGATDQTVNRKCIPLLARGVPNLSLDHFSIDSQAPGGELDADSRFGLEAELIPREPRKQVRFSDAGIPYENNLEEVVVVVLRPVTRHCREQILGSSLQKQTLF